ncbi:MAG: M13 family metallopeptidase [Sphingomonas fennica]
MSFRAPARIAAFALATTALFAVAAGAAPQLGTFGVDVGGMDRTIRPGDDFNGFVNGGWAARTPIPADKARYGAFNMLADQSDERTRTVIEAAAADPAATPEARKAADLYTSFMDEAGIEARGTAPLKADLARLDAMKTPADLAEAFAAGSRYGFDTPIGVGVQIDARDPDAYVPTIAQGGLGLPDRDYYLDKTNPRFAEARAAYQRHIAKMLDLAGVADGAAKAAAVLALETRLAEVQWSRVDTRQAEKRYNPVPVAELATRYPGLDWATYLKTVDLAGQPRVIVAQPSAIAATAKLAGEVPIATWRAYLAFHVVSARADVLPKAFVDEDFAFQRVLTGQPELKARWKRGVDFVNGGVGDAVGKLYVARYFPPDAKAKADALVTNLMAAMRVRLQQVPWMAPETRAKAVAKLASFRPKIGYPDVWEDYGAVTVRADDAYGNLQRTTAARFDRDVARLGRPADRAKWLMTPQTVNAYAYPVWNEVVFPAAILQPPFFDPAADPAVNYGAIGAVIGHEISHHFDDQGRKYDATGRLADWWTPADVARFKALTDKVVKQYGAYEALPGVKVNGELTLGENIADLAGLTVAHDAWLLSLNGKPAPVIGGFTGEQRFFLGFAQVWREKARDSFLQRQVASDPHSPGALRPRVVRNLDAWYGAFGAKPGDRLWLAPADRIKVW